MTKATEARKPIGALVQDPKNRRLHDKRNLGLVESAIREVGTARSIVIDEDDVILAGNGVTAAAAAAGITKVRIIETDGTELIAVRRSGLTKAQKFALALYDNRTAELATWNADQLKLDSIAGLDLKPFWTREELAKAGWTDGASSGLTEPDAGSDPEAMKTSARQDGSDWVIDGTKMWITNGGIAGVAIIWAHTENGIRGFIVPTDAPGFSTNDIRHKMSLRASVTSELVLDGVRVPEDAVLPDVVGLKGPLSCLNEARLGIVFGSTGAARACYEAALSYSKERVQFGRPIGSFQLTQRKLVEMMVKVNQASLLAMHLGRKRDAGTLTAQQVSFGKMVNVRSALEVAREARSVLGANGITLEYPVIRHMNNLESVYTYEGTNEIRTLVLGEAITGISAFQ